MDALGLDHGCTGSATLLQLPGCHTGTAPMHFPVLAPGGSVLGPLYLEPVGVIPSSTFPGAGYIRLTLHLGLGSG